MTSTSPGVNMTSSSTDISRAPRIMFLALFMVMSSVGSIVIFIVIAQNQKHRTSQNVLIANMCAVCMIDALFNMSLTMGALVMDNWIYGHFVCKINSFFLNFINIETILLLTIMSVDRFCSVRYSKKYETWLLSSCRVHLFIIYLWLHATAFSIPFLTEYVSSEFHSQLHLCSMAGDTSVYFVYATLTICFLAPLICILVFQIMTMWVAHKLRRCKRAEESQKHYTQVSTDSLPIDSVVSHPTSYTRCLVVLWLLLGVPFIITSFIKHYEYIETEGKYQILDYPWIIDAVFIWLKFFFSAIFPYVTFFCKKDLWQSTKESILCRRNNSIIDMGVAGNNSNTGAMVETSPTFKMQFSSPKNKAKAKDKEKAEALKTLEFNIPVLFATSTGICIKDLSAKEAKDPSYFHDEINDSINVIKVKKMDISYPEAECPNEIIGDTSDYDSSAELDQLSSSQPISARPLDGSLHRTRSLSNPEIFPPSQNKSSPVRYFSGTSGADSGLDLSSTLGNNSTILTSKSSVCRTKGASSPAGRKELEQDLIASDNKSNTHTRVDVDNRFEGKTSAYKPPRLKPIDDEENPKWTIKWKQKKMKEDKVVAIFQNPVLAENTISKARIIHHGIKTTTQTVSPHVCSEPQSEMTLDT